LVQERASAELVVLVSDNQSWVDARAAGPTEMLRLWEAFRVRNPQAKLVCIDLQPNRTTQALERPDVLNVGGFSDEVFEVVARFADGTLGADHWIGQIEVIEI
jgi:60 kDa SS-A/Ro ribonucleoprotein